MDVVGVGGEFLFDRVAGVAGAQSRKGISLSGLHLFGIEFARLGTAALDDETGNVAVKLQVVVKTLLCKLDEIAHVDRGVLAGKLNADIALGRLDNGDLIA